MSNFENAYNFITHSLEPKRIIVECPEHILNERTIKRVRRYQIRKDPPHTSHDEYHAHCELGGYEVCWTISGKRRHTNKFPADNKIPFDVKRGIAGILKVDVSLLECNQAVNDEEDNVLIVTVHDKAQ